MGFEGKRRPDWFGRGFGLAVFVVGIVLLVVVFTWTSQLAASVPTPGPKPDWMQWLVTFGIQLARLFISGLIASWIAGRGAQLYAAANRALSED